MGTSSPSGRACSCDSAFISTIAPKTVTIPPISSARQTPLRSENRPIRRAQPQISSVSAVRYAAPCQPQSSQNAALPASSAHLRTRIGRT